MQVRKGLKAEIVAKKGQRERIHPVWDGPAYLMDTAALSLVTQAVWMAWLLGCLYDPANGGRATKTLDEWARIGRCSVDQAKVAMAELKKNGTAEVSESRRCHGLVTLMSRRVYREYKMKEDNRLRQVRHRMSRVCNEKTAFLSQNEVPTVRKKDLKKDPSDPKDRGISRNEKKDPEQPSISGSVDKIVTEPIPTPITKEDVWSFGDIVRLAAAICGESKSAYTRNTFQARYRVIGDHAFRSEVASFFAELHAGEEPARRGKALTARLTALMEATEARKAIAASLATAAQATARPCRHCNDTGTIRDVPVPDGDFTEGGRRDLPCGFCLAGTREMERAGMPPAQQQELVRHEMAVLHVQPEEFAGRT